MIHFLSTLIDLRSATLSSGEATTKMHKRSLHGRKAVGSPRNASAGRSG
jgi:hypothetical protein